MELSVTEIFLLLPCIRKKLPVAGSVDTKVYKNRIMKFFKSKYRKGGKTGENQCFFSESQAE